MGGKQHMVRDFVYTMEEQDHLRDLLYSIVPEWHSHSLDMLFDPILA